MFAPISRLPRTVSLAVFRLHIENGVAVSVGVAMVAVAANLTLGLGPAVVAATGALCASFTDRPAPLGDKIRGLFHVLPPIIIATILAGLVGDHPVALAAATAFIGLWAGLVSVYPRSGAGLGMASVLAFAFGMEAAIGGPREVLEHAALFAGGALAYCLYAVAFSVAIEDRMHRMLLAEATRGFVAYLRAKAALYAQGDNAASGRAFRAMIEAHAVLVDRLQAARDAIFAGRRSPGKMRRVDSLIALLDAFEMILSSDADIELLRRSQHHHLMRRMARLTGALADDMEDMTVSLQARLSGRAPQMHETEENQISDEIARLERAPGADEPDEATVLAAFRSTASKIAQADARIQRFALAMEGRAPVSEAAQSLDLAPFVQAGAGGWRLLADQFSFRSPALRYAVRLAMAMSAGLLIVSLFTGISHGSWVLVTTAFVMRANYSITSQRRWDRVSGTLIGCVVAAVLTHLLPGEWLWAVIMVSLGIAHAYAMVDYRVSAVCATVNALLLLHFMHLGGQSLFYERVVDTLVAAAITYVFSFLLPSWERNDVPGAVARLLKADAGFAREALHAAPTDQNYRLARKRIVDAVANLSGAVRRMADEPNASRRALATLNELIGANYLLASDLASVQVIFRKRRDELDMARAEAMVAEVKEQVALTLEGGGAETPGQDARLSRRGITNLPTRSAMYVLQRRLVHVGHMARRVARLARRPLI